MKAFVVTFFAALISLKGLCQFAGKVTYHETYDIHSKLISSEEFTRFLGDRRELYIQGGYYKTLYFGRYITGRLYRGKENMICRLHSADDTLYWVDAAKDTLRASSVSSVRGSNEVVLGMATKKLIMRNALGKYTYYFNPAYKIDPHDFKDHHFESWDVYTSLAGAIPLKVVYEGGDFSFVSTAVKIEEMNLDSTVFELPKRILLQMK